MSKHTHERLSRCEIQQLLHEVTIFRSDNAYYTLMREYDRLLAEIAERDNIIAALLSSNSTNQLVIDVLSPRNEELESENAALKTLLEQIEYTGTLTEEIKKELYLKIHNNES